MSSERTSVEASAEPRTSPPASARARGSADTGVAGTANGPAVYTASSTWTEVGITWSNRPAVTAGPRDDKAAISSGTWVEFDVTPFVGGNGTYTFVLRTTSTDGIDFSSHEATTNRPQLVVTVAAP